MVEILELSADQFNSIGIATPRDNYCIVSNNFHNVPMILPYSWRYPTPAPTNPCQYFIETQE